MRLISTPRVSARSARAYYLGAYDASRRPPKIFSMTLDSLLVSQDQEIVRVIRPTLEKLSIDVEICHEARAGADMLISDKFDAIIVDCDDLKGGLAVLQGL